MSNFLQENKDDEFTPMEMEEFLKSAFDREFGQSGSSEDSPYIELKVVNSAFNRRIREFDLVNNGYKSIESFLLSAFDLYSREIFEAVEEFNLIKTISYFSAEFERAFHIDDQSESVIEKRDIYIPSKIREIDSSTNFKRALPEGFN